MIKESDLPYLEDEFGAVEEFYFDCEFCGALTPEDDMNFAGSAKVCFDCYTKGK